MNRISWGVQLSVSFRTSKRTQSRAIGICSSDHSDITLCVSSNRNPRISFGYNDPENPMIPCCGVFFFDTGELGKGSKKNDGVVFRICGVSWEWFNVLILWVESWFWIGDLLPHIFCHTSPIRKLTATLCLTLAVLLGGAWNSLQRMGPDKWNLVQC